MTTFRNHPDNPSNIESAAEWFQIAKDLAKGVGTTGAPWEAPKTAAEAIREAMSKATQALLDEVAEPGQDRRSPAEIAAEVHPFNDHLRIALEQQLADQ